MRIYQSKGESIEQAAANVRAVSTEHEEPVCLIYCGTAVTVWPDYSVSRIRELWTVANRATMLVATGG